MSYLSMVKKAMRYGFCVVQHGLTFKNISDCLEEAQGRKLEQWHYNEKRGIAIRLSDTGTITNDIVYFL